VIVSSKYEALVEVTRSSLGPGNYNEDILLSCGAKKVFEIQTEVPDAQQIVAHSQVLGLRSHPASMDGIAKLHIEAQLEGAGSGFSLPLGTVSSVPGSEGYALGAVYMTTFEAQAIATEKVPFEGDRKVLSALPFAQPAAGQKYADELSREYIRVQCDNQFIGGPVIFAKTSLFLHSDDPRSPITPPLIRLLANTPFWAWVPTDDCFPYPAPKGMWLRNGKMCRMRIVLHCCCIVCGPVCSV
jgi:hypothetical protein